MELPDRAHGAHFRSVNPRPDGSEVGKGFLGTAFGGRLSPGPTLAAVRDRCDAPMGTTTRRREPSHPYLRRPWSRASDRQLYWFMWDFAASALVSAFELVIGPTRAGVLLTLGMSVLIVATAWVERRHRPMSL